MQKNSLPDTITLNTPGFQSFDAPQQGEAAADRIALLRKRMTSAKIDAYIVPRGDEYRGEYVAAGSERLAWLTGFTGSSGMAVITRDRAVVLVDGRYRVQAKGQVPTKLVEVAQIPDTSMEDWLIDALPSGSIATFDPSLISLLEFERATDRLAPCGIAFKPLGRNLVDAIWGTARPAAPDRPVAVHPTRLAGRSAREKLDEIQTTLRGDGHDATVLTSPDSIAWLLNIRGSDIPHTPVVLCFAIVPAKGKVSLFVKSDRLSPEVRAHLKPVASIKPPDDFGESLSGLRKDGKAVRVSPASCNLAIVRRLGGAKTVSRAPDPCLLPKAIKTKAEIRGARQAHIRDGSAMCRFLAWLDRTAPSGTVDEISAARHLEALRAATGKLEEISFDTISGSGPHGAIVHYRVTERSNRTLQSGELYLVDSGGQYRDATTDVTRTVVVGTPTNEMQDRFTRVLKGHIAIATARFPEGTRGVDIDVLARAALWSGGFDFDHGTGHGVGSYLSVHEGPQSISKRGMTPLRPGMIISNEPGYYKEGAYGIRIENLVLVRDGETPAGGERPMLSFETLTLAPIDRRLIDPTCLTDAERDWLNAYHARVAEEIGPQLDAGDLRWLKAACKRI